MAYLIIFIIMICISILVGYKRGTIKSLFSICSNLLIVFLSFIIARICVSNITDKKIKTLLKIANNKFELNAGDIIYNNSMQTILRFIITIIVSLAVFYVSCFILLIICQILKKVIFKAIKHVKYKEYSEENNYEKIGGILISALSTTITFIILTMPSAVAFKTMEDVIKDSGFKAPSPVKAVVNNPTYGIFKSFGGEYLFDKLTEMPNNDGIETRDEIRYTSTIVFASINIADDYSNINMNESVKIIKKSLSKSNLLPTLIAEVGSEAGKNWKEGKSFMRTELEIPDGREGKLTRDFLDVLSSINKKSVIEDVNTILDTYLIFEEYGLSDVGDSDEFIESFANEEFASDLCICLFKNKDLAHLVQPIIEYGLGSTFDLVGLELEEGFTSNVDISKLSEDEVRNEVKIVSNVIRVVLKAVNSTDSLKNISQDTTMELTEAFMDLKNSILLGEVADDIMSQVMHNIN